jgi:digeranylgeranylglycerophospholipid reductase
VPADVIVVGAGPAGLAAAEVTARGGLVTHVLERADAVGVPVRTSGGSWIADLRELGIGPEFYHPVQRIRLATPRAEAVFAYEEPLACVLRVKELYQHLAQQAIAAGAVLRLRTSVLGVVSSGGAVAGVRLRSGPTGEGQQAARVVIDASGYASHIGQAAGLHVGFPEFGLGAEQDLYAPNFDAREAWLMVGEDVAPGGYGWAFPDGRGRLRLGVGVPRPPRDADPRTCLERMPVHFSGLREQLNGAGPVECHTGLVPFAAPRHVPLVADGLLVAGDAGGQVSALVGEGIRYAIHAGRLAGETAVAGVQKGDVSAAFLRRYERAWYQRFEWDLQVAYRVYQRIVRYCDADWDAKISQLRHLSPCDLAQGLRGDFSLSWGFGIALKHPQLLGSIARALATEMTVGSRVFPRGGGRRM